MNTAKYGLLSKCKHNNKIEFHFVIGESIYKIRIQSHIHSCVPNGHGNNSNNKGKGRGEGMKKLALSLNKILIKILILGQRDNTKVICLPYTRPVLVWSLTLNVFPQTISGVISELRNPWKKAACDCEWHPLPPSLEFSKKLKRWGGWMHIFY